MLRQASLVLALTAAALAGPGDAMEARDLAPVTSEADGPVEVFAGPRALELAEPRYPPQRQDDDREGWVRLNFMIDSQGRPYEIAVTGSTGDALFEHAAVQAVKRSRFSPASLDGRPIDAGFALTYEFALEGVRAGARPAFVAGYRALSRAVNDGDRARADRELERLRVRNLYENAFYNVGEFIYHQRWGSVRQQLAALARAVGHDGDRIHLPEDLFDWCLRALFSLQIEARDYADALITWERIRQRPLEPGEAAAFPRAVAEIESLRDDERPFTVQGQVGESASWFYRLLKHGFRVDQVQGRIAELKLRCERKFVFFTHDPAVTYRVVEEHAPCLLEVVGDPGTTFRLVQS